MPPKLPPKIVSPHDAQIPAEIDPTSGLLTGPLLENAAAALPPQRVALEGLYARLEPLDPTRHSDHLYAAATVADAAARFLYLPTEPPANRAVFDAWMVSRATTTDALYFAVIDKATGRAEGRQSLMRIDPANQCVEIGDIYWGPAITRSRVTTEANFLFARYAFDQLGFRRYEWKCNALNMPSRLAAERFGFTYEGHFRRSNIVKGRSRDTTWYAIIADEWPAVRAGYEAWLAADNFTADGQQRQTLADLILARRILARRILASRIAAPSAKT
jgi:RimJ/RimL family protein N-acetyltransferase